MSTYYMAVKDGSHPYLVMKHGGGELCRCDTEAKAAALIGLLNLFPDHLLRKRR